MTSLFVSLSLCYCWYATNIVKEDTVDDSSTVLEWIGVVLAFVFGLTMICQGHFKQKMDTPEKKEDPEARAVRRQIHPQRKRRDKKGIDEVAKASASLMMNPILPLTWGTTTSPRCFCFLSWSCNYVCCIR